MAANLGSLDEGFAEGFQGRPEIAWTFPLAGSRARGGALGLGAWI
jgi:hypothetical protein